MAAIANLTLLNAAAGNVVYKPMQTTADGAQYADTTAGVLNAYKKVALKRTVPSNPSVGNIRIRTVNEYPVVDANGVVLRKLVAYTDYVLPASSTAAERAELLAREKSLQSSTVVADAVNSFELPY